MVSSIPRLLLAQGGGLVGLLVMGMVGVAQSQQCNALFGQQQQVILGDTGAQFFPENNNCPDRIVAPECAGGIILRYTDPDDPHHLTRYACAASPANGENLPLVIHFHGARAPTVDESFSGYEGKPPKTDLLAEMTSTSLAPGKTGYVLLMPQGRCLTAPRAYGGNGTHHDIWWKDPRSNFDVRAAQAFIRQLYTRTTQDEQGNPIPLPANFATVDQKRVYLMGHSNGAFFAHMLMFLFPTQFAAAATAAGADPYAQVECPTPTPLVTRKVPVITVHATCDPLVACDCSDCQRSPNEPVVENWVQTMLRRGWTADLLQDVVTDESHEQVVCGCEFGPILRQRLCPESAHGFPNPQLPSMFAYLRRYHLP